MSNRVNELLAALLNGETADITPQSRVEALLKALIEGLGTEGLPEPQSATEAYLYAMVENGLGGGGSGGSTKNLCAAYIGGHQSFSVGIIFEDGMTWEEFAASPYNTHKYLDNVEGEYKWGPAVEYAGIEVVCSRKHDYWVSYSGTYTPEGEYYDGYVHSSDPIIPNYEYTWAYID